VHGPRLRSRADQIQKHAESWELARWTEWRYQSPECKPL
jgi:hypothetical protein